MLKSIWWQEALTEASRRSWVEQIGPWGAPQERGTFLMKEEYFPEAIWNHPSRGNRCGEFRSPISQGFKFGGNIVVWLNYVSHQPSSQRPLLSAKAWNQLSDVSPLKTFDTSNLGREPHLVFPFRALILKIWVLNNLEHTGAVFTVSSATTTIRIALKYVGNCLEIFHLSSGQYQDTHCRYHCSNLILLTTFQYGSYFFGLGW